jgi:hypothetical protein
MIMVNEMKESYKEAIIVFLEVLSLNLTGETEEHSTETWSGEPVSRLF